jgi:hypothetical protein
MKGRPTAKRAPTFGWLPTGQLAHRVRSLYLHFDTNPTSPPWHVVFHCGRMAGPPRLALGEDPPDGLTVCLRCSHYAKKAAGSRVLESAATP